MLILGLKVIKPQSTYFLLLFKGNWGYLDVDIQTWSDEFDLCAEINAI